MAGFWSSLWRSLNRTSVGLKHLSDLLLQPLADLPQSNQRGIETRINSGRSARKAEPQSNQRGIETVCLDILGAYSNSSLNRTSVGLKPNFPALVGASRKGLNRTSVGLKRYHNGGTPLGRTQASIEPAWD